LSGIANFHRSFLLVKHRLGTNLRPQSLSDLPKLTHIAHFEEVAIPTGYIITVKKGIF